MKKPVAFIELYLIKATGSFYYIMKYFYMKYL